MRHSCASLKFNYQINLAHIQVDINSKSEKNPQSPCKFIWDELTSTFRATLLDTTCLPEWQLGDWFLTIDKPARRNISQCGSLVMRQTTFLNYIKFAHLRIWRPQNCEMFVLWTRECNTIQPSDASTGERRLFVMQELTTRPNISYA